MLCAFSLLDCESVLYEMQEPPCSSAYVLFVSYKPVEGLVINNYGETLLLEDRSEQTFLPEYCKALTLFRVLVQLGFC